MTTIDRPLRTSTARRSRLRPERRPSDRLVSDGIVASYIHDISQRHSAPRRHPAAAETATFSALTGPNGTENTPAAITPPSAVGIA